MNRDDEINEYERYINQVAADTEVMKVVLTVMLVRMSTGRGTELVDDLAGATKLILEQAAPAAAADHPMTHRLHQLKLSRADDYFRDLRNLLGGTPQSVPPRQRN